LDALAPDQFVEPVRPQLEFVHAGFWKQDVQQSDAKTLDVVVTRNRDFPRPEVT